MNTLSKAITAQWFQSEGDYEALRSWWKAKNADPNTTVTATDVMLYMTLLGRDWRKAFSPVVRQVELENGRWPYDTARRARANVYHWSLARKNNPAYAERLRINTFWQSSPISPEALSIAINYIGDFSFKALPQESYVSPIAIPTAKVIAEQPVYQEVQIVS